MKSVLQVHDHPYIILNGNNIIFLLGLTFSRKNVTLFN